MLGFPPKGAVCTSTPGRTTHLEAAGHQVATHTFQLCTAPLQLRAETHLQLFVVIHIENENTKIFAYYPGVRGRSATIPVGY